MRVVKLALIVVILIAGFLLGWPARRFNKLAWRDRIACACHAMILRVIGVRVAVRGQVSGSRPLLVVANHLSYLDVSVLYSVFPFRFTPKSDIASWPGIATLCRAADAVFIDRRPEKLAESLGKVQQALANGHVVCLFPEATTGNGIHMLPFKSGFFSLAEQPAGGQELQVQPVAIVYTRIHRLPIASYQWPAIAWYGDMEFLPHLWELLKLGHIDVEVVLLSPATLKEHGDRKRLAAHCERAIAEAIETTKANAFPAVKGAWGAGK